MPIYDRRKTEKNYRGKKPWKAVVHCKRLYGSKRPTECFRLESEAKAWELEMTKRKRSTGGKGILFDEALDAVLENSERLAAKGHIQPGTLINHRRGIKALRVLGHVPIDVIDTPMIQKVMDDLQKKDQSSHMIAGVMARKAMAEACKPSRGWRDDNPFIAEPLDWNPPRKAKKDLSYLEEDIQHVLQAQLDHGRKEHFETQELRHDVLTVAAWTGMRPEEYAAMCWENVIWETGYYRVSHVWSDAGHCLKDTAKTPAGERMVKLVPDVMEMLRRRWERAGRPKKGFAFLNQKGKPIYDDLPNLYWGAMKKAGKLVLDEKTGALKPKFRLYDWRHCNISTLHALGAPLSELSAHAGHARTSFTLDTYVHQVTKERQVDRLLVERNNEARRKRGIEPPAPPAPVESVIAESGPSAEEVFAKTAEERRAEAQRASRREIEKRHQAKVKSGEIVLTPEQIERRRKNALERGRRYRERLRKGLTVKKPVAPEILEERRAQKRDKQRRRRALKKQMQMAMLNAPGMHQSKLMH